MERWNRRPHLGRVRIGFGITLALTLLASSAWASPMSFSSGLGFATGTQSLWGPGGSKASFGAASSAAATIAGVRVGAAYDVGASAGTATASLSGTLSAQYEDTLALPGVTRIDVGFAGTSANVKTHLGAHADVTGFVHDVPLFGPWDFCFYCQDWSLDTNITFAPTFGVQRSASDSFAVAGVGPDIALASAKLSMNANQTSFFTPSALTGLLTYRHRDTGTLRTASLSLAGLGFVDVDLDLPGIWDFAFLDLDIANVFSTKIGMNLSADLDCCFGAVSKTFPFGNVSLLDTPSFGLDFGALSPGGGFSIAVIPEPGTALLLAVGLGGLAGFGRPRRGPRRA